MDREQFAEKRRQARRARRERLGIPTYDLRIPRPPPPPRGLHVVNEDGSWEFVPEKEPDVEIRSSG